MTLKGTIFGFFGIKSLRKNYNIDKQERMVHNPRPVREIFFSNNYRLYWVFQDNCANFAYKIRDQNGNLIFMQNLRNYPGKMIFWYFYSLSGFIYLYI